MIGDYALLTEIDPGGGPTPDAREGRRRKLTTNPRPAMRALQGRPFTRLTNAFSKKLANHAHMVALYTCWYNFVKMHKTIGCTPAMAAKVTDTLWSMSDLVALVDRYDDGQPRKKAGRKPKLATVSN